MFIVDGQVHIWKPNTPDRPWAVLNPPYTPHRPTPFSKDDLLREMEGAGVSRAVLAPPPLEGWRNDTVLEAARMHPDRFTAMGLLDINSPSARGQITRWRQQPGMQGLRINFKVQGNPADDWVWEEAESARVPIMTMMSPPQLRLIGEAAQRHPGVKIIIDHFAIQRNTKDAEAFEHFDKLIALAKIPNVAVKASALPDYVSDEYPYRSLHPYIRRAYDAFGPKRVFWGTDFTRLQCSYRQAVTLFTEELPWLNEDDKEWIMGRGLCEWIGWALP